MDNESIIFSLYGALIPESYSGFSLQTLYALLKCFNLSKDAVRLALSRMNKKGYFIIKKQGRRSFYLLSEQGREIVQKTETKSIRRIEAADWNGLFHILTYEIPEIKKSARKKITENLPCHGFARVAAGSWISPYPAAESLYKQIQNLELSDHIRFFSAQYTGDTKKLASDLWNLTYHEKQLRGYNQKYTSNLENILSPEDSFKSYFISLYDFIKVMASIPPLPQQLLPDNWPAEETKQIFTLHRSKVREQANTYFLSVYETYKHLPEGERT